MDFVTDNFCRNMGVGEHVQLTIYNWEMARKPEYSRGSLKYPLLSYSYL